MLPLPPDISDGDVQQWLEGGYFYVMRNDVPVLCGYRGVRDGAVVVTSIPERHEWRVDRSTIRVHWPLCGALNLPQRAVAVQLNRLQRRQYRRTYNARCVEVTVPGKWHCLKKVDAGTLHMQGNTDDLLMAAFSPEYPADAREAHTRLTDGGWASVAVSNALILVGGPKSTVYYHGDNVGIYDGVQYMPDCDQRTAAAVAKILGG